MSEQTSKMQCRKSSCSNADWLLRPAVKNVMDDLQGDPSTRSVTSDNVRKICGSEACKFALSIRPKDMPTPPWTGENYMVPSSRARALAFRDGRSKKTKSFANSLLLITTRTQENHCSLLNIVVCMRKCVWQASTNRQEMFTCDISNTGGNV